MPFDPEIQQRRSRKAMQMKAQTTHTGEERWSTLDNQCVECISSGCSIVGFFVGYGVALGQKVSDLCESRKKDAETNIDWSMMPPLCRPDNVNEKNKEVEEKRQKTDNVGDKNKEVEEKGPEKEMQEAVASSGTAEDAPGNGDEPDQVAPGDGDELGAFLDQVDEEVDYGGE